MGETGWFIGPNDNRPMHPQQVQALRRERLAHDLVHLLQSRGAQGFICAHQESAEIDLRGERVKVERIAASLHGATTLLSIDPDRNHVVAMSFRGRGPRLTFGSVERIFKTHREMAGVSLPMDPETRFDGEIVPSPAGEISEVRLDIAVDEHLFRPLEKR